MLFTSPLFLLFFLLVLGVYALFRWQDDKRNATSLGSDTRSRTPLSQAWLLAASLVFYAGWEFPRGLWFIPLLVGTSILDWWSGGLMYRLARSEAAKRRALLYLSIALNLGSLAIFKYLGFFANTLNDLAALAKADWQVTVPKLILPLGISFFTFQSMSYTIDAYRRRGRPYRSAFDFLFFVTFFPQLIAGPIVRAEQFRDQILRRQDSGLDALSQGIRVIAVGLLLKVVMGDSVAVRVDRLYQELESITPIDALVAYYGFGLQIFCDFAGYSLIAIGLARCFGFSLPQNFDMPYLAVGLRDFWRRWHITLSTWLRDYLYIPLGGSRHGVSRTACALALTMLLGGLWHGASWNFVIWGGAHGLLLAAGRVTRSALPSLAKWQEHALFGRTVTWFVTLHIVFLLWVPFRAQTLSDTGDMLALLAQAPSSLAEAFTLGLSGVMHHESMLILPFISLFALYHVASLLGWRAIPKFLRSPFTESPPDHSIHVHGPRHLLPEDAILRLKPIPAGVIVGCIFVLASIFHIGGVTFIYFAF